MKKIVVIPERCSGCRLCEITCSMAHFSRINPKKSAVKVVIKYPQPTIRMPIICHQCKVPKCAENCPTEAIAAKNGTILIDKEKCISCLQCVTSCPFGAIFVHSEVETPFKCDLCSGNPQCVEVCPKKAILFLPEHTVGQAQRIGSLLKYAQLKEIEYVEKGEHKKIKYTMQEE